MFQCLQMYVTVINLFVPVCVYFAKRDEFHIETIIVVFEGVA